MANLYDSREQQPPRSGLLLLQACILGLFCVFALRLWYLQVHKGEEYAEKAKENQLRQEPVFAPRGLVLDRGGTMVAVNEPAYALGLVREDVKNLDATLAEISHLTGTPLDKLQEAYRRGRKRVKPFEPMLIVPDLDFEQVASVEANHLRWPGLEIVVRSRRYYKFGHLLAHVLGYVGDASEDDLEKDSSLALGDYVGKNGLEQMLERRLRGTKGVRQMEVDATGRRLSEALLKKPKSGEDIVLSVDLGLQATIARQLEGKAGSVVVMDPDTGELLALVSSPSFDSNAFTAGLTPEQWKGLRDDPMHPLQNRATQSVYPPGSVFKLVMAGAGFMANMLDPRETAFCQGSLALGSHVFRCWRKGGHGSVDLEQALVQSCDVYFYKLGMKLGVDRISEFSFAAGFGKPTGIDLPHEKGGNIPTKEWKLKRFGQKWTKGEDLNFSIGQGYTQVSPLQVARYISALINGGRLLKPNLIHGDPPVLQGRLPLTEAQRLFIKKAMVATVEDPRGTCRRVQTPGVTAGAKTGTAQVVRLTDELKAMPEDKIPYQMRDHAWMAGFAERGDRRVVVVAMVEHGLHGGSGAGPSVKTVFDYVFLGKGLGPVPEAPEPPENNE
ncbi:MULTISPECIES: penicillin-binding protein 2 [Desulfovibrio]|jgi:penicillin-binding protein 2|uniref:penicillin-binding protein 2 n=1 Tax=Desulfovibrio TaxID=872 RepID=UPI00041AD2D3|nr:MULTISPECIES: penicillin-binding protein 2 [Desulfovibrio]MDY0305128.1 penicillin-binding protein 2 [Desulfovibrionaceae bacterium]HMM39576.1 penicillin-binding protein 2 [Desulfovibrio sp.]